jgi:hypothetical protein
VARALSRDDRHAVDLAEHAVVLAQVADADRRVQDMMRAVRECGRSIAWVAATVDSGGGSYGTSSALHVRVDFSGYFTSTTA